MKFKIENGIINKKETENVPSQLQLNDCYFKHRAEKDDKFNGFSSRILLILSQFHTTHCPSSRNYESTITQILTRLKLSQLNT